MGELEIVKFKDENFEIEVKTDFKNETVWLTKDEISLLFERDRTVISKHINNIYKSQELEKEFTCAKNAHMGNNGKQEYFTEYFNLDVIISVGYRVNSKRGIQFRKRANKILKDYLIQGYSINKKRLDVLNKTIEIQSKMLANTLNIDQEKLSNVIFSYTNALDLLDSYDHQTLKKPKGNNLVYELNYEEARKIIDNMKFSETSALFGKEKVDGKLNGILQTIHQNVFGQEVYPSIEEKAAHLLYFLVKDHPFYDGCKRIAATLFLEFLNKNNILIKNHKMIIDNDTLVAITILFAESKPEEMEIMITLLMNLLNK